MLWYIIYSIMLYDIISYFTSHYIIFIHIILSTVLYYLCSVHVHQIYDIHIRCDSFLYCQVVFVEARPTLLPAQQAERCFGTRGHQVFLLSTFQLETPRATSQKVEQTLLDIQESYNILQAHDKNIR